MSVALAVILALATPAAPCPRYVGSELPLLDGRELTGAPLLLLTGDASLLSRVGLSEVIPLLPRSRPDLGLPDAWGRRAFEVSTPLVPGLYAVDSTGFTITATDAVGALDVHAVPQPGRTTTLSLQLDNSSGCNLSRLRVELGVPAGPDDVFLVIAQLDGVERRWLLGVTREADSNTIDVTGANLALESTRACVQLAGVSRTGTVGPQLDLGCVDPNDPADPRVTRARPWSPSEPSGCSAMPGSGDMVAGALIVIGVVRARRRRPRG